MSDTAALSRTENKSEKIKHSNGGARPGAGRKKGSPNKVTAEIRTIAQAYGAAAIEQAARLAGLIVEDGEPIGVANSEQARISAIGIILDRAYGKAPQPLVGDADQPIKQVLEIVWQASNGRAS